MKIVIICMFLSSMISLAAVGFETATLKGVIENPSSKKFKIDKAPQSVDRRLTERVARRLYGDKFFSPEVIQIESESGVVTLQGEVDSLRSKAQAVSLAERVRGVSAVIDELRVKIFARSDDQILKDVNRALMLDAATAPYKLNIKVSAGGVELHGTVTSWAEKNLASWTVKGVKGVSGIDNQIQIVRGARRDDREIKADVVALLRRDPIVRDDLLQVRVQGGIVTVSGQVPTIAQERRIYEEALVSGVTGINLTGVRVEPTLNNGGLDKKAPRNDDEIQTAATRALALDPRLRDFKLHVDVNNNIATLSGGLSNLKARSAARHDLEDTVGVVSVEDKTDLVTAKHRSDAEVLKDVTEVIDLDPGLYNQGIKVEVTKGDVKLSGATRSIYQRGLAGDTTSHVDGVTNISNRLTVSSQPVKADRSDDQTIMKSLTEMIRDDSELNSRDVINVTVKGGHAILTGNVFSWPDITQATEDAFNSGAVKVANNLKVIGRLSSKLKTYSEMPSEIYSLHAWSPGDMNEGAFKVPDEAAKKGTN